MPQSVRISQTQDLVSGAGGGWEARMRKQTLNDEDRRQWIANDEGLYRWQRSSRLNMRAFIRANRAELDEVIRKVRDGERRAHYLIYG